MAPTWFEQARLPLAVLLVAIAAVVFWPRNSSEGASASPSASVVLGELGGEVLRPSETPEPSLASTPIPTQTPLASPTAAPSAPSSATPAPASADDGFTAEVLACRSISGSTCNDQLGTLPANAGSFTALVRFTDANAGDQLNATLEGPAGTIGGFPYALQGGGDGYYYSEFQAGSLPAGDYTLTATRNGEVVATTSFSKAGG